MINDAENVGLSNQRWSGQNTVNSTIEFGKIGTIYQNIDREARKQQNLK